MSFPRDLSEMLAAEDDLLREFQQTEKALREVREAIRTRRAELFIKANKVTKNDVQLSSGEGVPWFGNIFAFSEWLRGLHSIKRFCEWNGSIYFSSDMLNGRLTKTGVRVEDVEGLL
jgi:hypothetical protein